MKKKIILIVILIVILMVFIIGLAFFEQWYADTRSNKEAVVEVLDLETKTFDLGKGVTLEMVHLPAGTLRMGSADDALSFLPGRTEVSPDEQPAHPVELSEFWIGKYEVTQEQYEAMKGKNRSKCKGAKNPVEKVSWDNAMAFCKALSTQTGTSFTLPTEAQWEYACRAGSTTAFCFGNDESILGDYAWNEKNSGNVTHPVGQKMPNHWGLYDMHGNVWEWCRDSYDGTFYGTSAAIVKNPENTKKTNHRVLRGGSWDYNIRDCRSAFRYKFPYDQGDYSNGFRVVRTQP